MNLKENILRYLDAGFPILYINTFEEIKTENIIKNIADRHIISIWSMAGGYGEFSSRNQEWIVPYTKDNFTDLDSILTLKLSSSHELDRTIFVIKDAHIVLQDENIIAAFKEIALRIANGLDCCLILLSPIIKIPMELEKYITILYNDIQSFEDICQIIHNFIIENGLPLIPDKLLEDLAIAFKGLSEYEIHNLLALAVADDGELSKKDLSLIFEQKKQMILKSGILEMIPLKEKIDDIGGLDNLKTWLKQKEKVLKNIQQAEKFGVDMPKGVLIAGVPGCGKSLTAKAAASLFGVPILRLDIGKLMGKYLGESEANLRKAIELADAISPCVLWVDELEKAFAGIGNDNGHEVTTRLFGAFLTWMQEKTSSTFVVATANDVTKLPPELLRKGRFDEIFFVDLPNQKEREMIFRIHIQKRRKADFEKLDSKIHNLAELTDGYSGADIEGVVKDGVEIAFVNDHFTLSDSDIKKAIKNTNSLSVIMKDSIDKMRKEFEVRKFKNASK